MSNEEEVSAGISNDDACSRESNEETIFIATNDEERNALLTTEEDLASVIQKEVFKVDLDSIIAILLKPKGRIQSKLNNAFKVPEKDMKAICRKAGEIFLNESSLLEIGAPMKVCGDIHGQYIDLLRVFELGGHPPETKYLFLGDYVDRGKKSLETMALLLAYKIKYPNKMYMLRGNHESYDISLRYGFYDECKRRYNVRLWRDFISTFNCLPVAAIVDGRIFCCHGGLSPHLTSMDQIRSIERPSDVEPTGLMCDLLWSDPAKNVSKWGPNDRGVSVTFGAGVVYEFLKKYDYDMIVRAHQVVEDGYEFFAERSLVTIFSAPNYCGQFRNQGALMSVNEDLYCSFQMIKKPR